ncbi:hypothetical protein ACO2Q8_08950 [Larkinella sp. VNQ87]|uniref:hypothetical protein n=1 Tax=Larkinella sp. VNQ87 TaxID=3400921 RepID=UPI003C0F33D2
MRPALEEVQRLDAYLHETLNEEQRMEVEIRLLWDRDWQWKLAAQKLAYQALRLAGRRQLRRELDGMHTRLFG